MAESMTSIESLPVNCLLQILSHLPFKEHVRVGGVNRFFSDLSMAAIDRMKTLDLTNDIKKYSLWNRPFASLLQSCSPNLERINASFSCNKDFLEILPTFHYPKLNHLEIIIADSWNEGEIEVAKQCAFDLIDRNRGIRSITLRLAHEFEFPKNIIFEKLERLEIYGCRKKNPKTDLPTGLVEEWYEDRPQVSFDGLLRSLNGQVPNLKHFLIMTYRLDEGRNPATVDDPSVLNSFLDSVRDLKSLHLKLDDQSINHGVTDFIVHFPHIWRHGSLIELGLEIYDDSYEDFAELDLSVVDKICSSFPNLKTLISGAIQHDAVTTLKKLKNLRYLHLHGLLASNQVFMELMALPKLEYLEIKRSYTIYSTRLFASLLASIPENRKKITIQFNCYYFERIWDTKLVKMVLEQMKANGRPDIRIIGWPWRKCRCDS